MKLKNWFKVGRGPHHLIARVICLAVAVVVWLYVMRVAPPTYDETYRDVAVEVEESDILSDFTGSVDSVLSLRVWGTKAALYEYDADDVRAYVKIADLADFNGSFGAGKTYELLVYFELPEGLEVRDEYRVSMLLENKVSDNG